MFESKFLSIEFGFNEEKLGVNEFGELGWFAWPLRNEGDISLEWDMLLFLMLKNFLAFSSSSQLLAGDQMIFGLDETEVIKEVGVLGPISYGGDEGGDQRELPSIEFRFNGEGVLLVHKSNGVSSTGFLGIERQVPLPAIEDIKFEINNGENWLRLVGGSCLAFSKFTFAGYSDINLWYWMMRFCMYNEGIKDAAGWIPYNAACAIILVVGSKPAATGGTVVVEANVGLGTTLLINGGKFDVSRPSMEGVDCTPTIKQKVVIKQSRNKHMSIKVGKRK